VAGLGGDRYRATFTPPSAGKPTRALVAAWDEDSGEVATALVALAARIEIPVETDAGARVVVTLHGRRSTARADSSGHARVVAWVWPDEERATVTATDAAGNATTNEIALDVGRPEALFVLAPAALAAGDEARVYAFTVAGAVPQLTASSGRLAPERARDGVAAARLSARGEVTLVAAAGEARVQRRIPQAVATLPPEHSVALASVEEAAAGRAAPPAAVAATPALATLSPWEAGLTLSGRYGGSLGGVAVALLARRRLGRFAVGLDLDGRWAAGFIGMDPASLGGFGARAVGEWRLTVAPRVGLYLAVALGGHYARVTRVNPANKERSSDDGGPTLGAAAGVLWQLGPGAVDVALGFAWSPLIGSGRVNADGGAISVGYRVARWRRRGGGRRRAHRRRRARGR